MRRQQTGKSRRLADVTRHCRRQDDFEASDRLHTLPYGDRCNNDIAKETGFSTRSSGIPHFSESRGKERAPMAGATPNCAFQKSRWHSKIYN